MHDLDHLGMVAMIATGRIFDLAAGPGGNHAQLAALLESRIPKKPVNTARICGMAASPGGTART